MTSKKKKKYYSHSKIGTFEQCPRKFKYKYIERIPESLKTIEAHLGTVVHATLEWLYKLAIEKKEIPDVSEVISFYTEKWREEFTTDTRIIKQGTELKDYFSKGVRFLLEYYNRHYPFGDNTLEVEKKILINLDEDGKYIIQGYIDRLSYDIEKKEYEIHDYKTGNNFPDKEKVENDRQLALYSLAIREVVGEDKKICLTWHYLAYDRKVCSRRTNKQLDELKEKILKQIKEIESTEKFPTFISPLCDWCGYKNLCPAWRR